MATKTVSGYHDEAIAVNASGNTWRLIENATIVSNDFGFSVAVGASNNRFDIAGHIQAGTGINGLAPRMSVDIRDTGSIYAANGISMQGTGRFVADIDGTIDATQSAVMSLAAINEVTLGASGSLSGVHGLYITGGTSLAARIDGDIDAIQYGVSAAADEATIVVGRQASIEGQYGVYSASLYSEISNQGEINGFIGISATGDDSRIVNGAFGVIRYRADNRNRRGFHHRQSRHAGQFRGRRCDLLRVRRRGPA